MKLRDLLEFGSGDGGSYTSGYGGQGGQRGQLSIQHVFSGDEYHSAEEAFKEFKDLNKMVSNQQQTDIQTVKNFLRNVYKGGNHAISQKEFIKYLANQGVTVFHRNDSMVSDMKKV
jgi:hypothetical protein